LTTVKTKAKNKLYYETTIQKPNLVDS
jgi:hypothetical protein